MRARRAGRRSTSSCARPTERLGGKIAHVAVRRPARVDEGADAFLARVPAGRRAGRHGRARRRADLTAPTDARPRCGTTACTRSPAGSCSACPAASCGRSSTELAADRGGASCAPPPSRCCRATPIPTTRSARSCAPASATRSTSGSSTPLVGSIYAADTDRASLARSRSSPQLAGEHRSLLLGARGARRRTPAAAGPGLRRAAAAAWARSSTPSPTPAVRAASRSDRARSATLARDGDGWRVDGERVDAVVLATPGTPRPRRCSRVSPPEAARACSPDRPRRRRHRHAGRAGDWPRPARRHERLPRAQAGAAPRDGGVVRIAEVGALGAGGRRRSCACRSGATAAASTTSTTTRSSPRLDEVGRHLGLDLQPTALRITRWPAAFPQYRPPP